MCPEESSCCYRCGCYWQHGIDNSLPPPYEDIEGPYNSEDPVLKQILTGTSQALNDTPTEIDSRGHQNDPTKSRSQKNEKLRMSRTEFKLALERYYQRNEDFILSKYQGIDSVKARLRLCFDKVLRKVFRISNLRLVGHRPVDSSLVESLYRRDDCILHHKRGCFCIEYTRSQEKRTFNLLPLVCIAQWYYRNVEFTRLSGDLIRWRKSDLDILYELSKLYSVSLDE